MKVDEKKWLNTIITCYDKFLSEDHEDTFDFVTMVFLENFTIDDLEMQKDMFLHYCEVPVCQVFMTSGMKEESSEVTKV